MNILLPHNIFTNLLAQALPETLHHTLAYKNASLLAKSLVEQKADIVLLPVTDLLQHKEFFVSQHRGISFDGPLSNAYFYFGPEQQHIHKVTLAGDISSAEVLCTKILLRELYNEEAEISISTTKTESSQSTLLLSGDINLENNRFFSGMNMTEEIMDVIDLPFVHYVFAALDEEKIKRFDKLTEGIEGRIYEAVDQEDWEFRLTPEAKEFYRSNISHVVYEFDAQDKEGIQQLLRLPYFHNMVDDLIDVKFAD
jgi:hypothetical protein